MSTTEDAMITFRKTKNGEWVVMGPVSEIRVHTVLEVTKKDGGTAKVRVTDMGKPFEVDGKRYCYGYNVQFLGSTKRETVKKDAPKKLNGAATEAQLSYIKKLLYRLEQIPMFDSVVGTGEQHAASFIERLNSGLTKQQASEMIEQIIFLLDDEM